MGLLQLVKPLLHFPPCPVPTSRCSAKLPTSNPIFSCDVCFSRWGYIYPHAAAFPNSVSVSITIVPNHRANNFNTLNPAPST